jgi:Cd2+/Zn2+-exporting ATPase
MKTETNLLHIRRKIQHKTDKQTGCCSTHEEPKHSDDDGHDHSNSNKLRFKCFTSYNKFVLLLIAIGFDNYFHSNLVYGLRTNGLVYYSVYSCRFCYLRKLWKYLKRRNIFRISIDVYCNWSVLWRISEGVAVMLFLCHWWNISNFAVQRQKPT